MIMSIDHSSPPSCQSEFPTTLAEAVEQLSDLLSDWDELPSLPEVDEIALECLHATVGPYIRNRFGLWEGNKALFTS